MAGLWCVQVGYGREELAKAAYDQMLELPYYNTFFKTVAPPTVLLAAKVAALLGGDLQHVFFNNSGSEAIDTVIRLARHYWQAKGEPNRNIIIARVNGYHGSTIAGASLGGMKHMHAQGGPWVPGIEHVMQPYQFNEGFGEDPAAFAARAADAFEDAHPGGRPRERRRLHRRAGAGRRRRDHPAAGYWPRVEAICRKYGILLVCDEVICGFGRLGRWFGFQHFGVKPDMVTMAKGLSSGYLPISAVGVADHIVETLREIGGDFVHGYTYSGHPTCAAVALKNIEIMEREGLVERTATRHRALSGQGAGRPRGPPAGRRDALARPDRRGRDRRQARGPTNASPARKARPGLMVRDLCIRQRPDGAGDARHHRDEPAADHQPRADRPDGGDHPRRAGRSDPGAQGAEGCGLSSAAEITTKHPQTTVRRPIAGAPFVRACWIRLTSAGRMLSSFSPCGRRWRAEARRMRGRADL